MSKVINIFLLLLFVLFGSQAIAENSISDSTTIKLQVVVTESMLPQKCAIGFDSHTNDLFHSSESNCKFNSTKLIQEATQLASRKLKQENGMQFVTITVTAP